ncbi:MAG: tetratricopeptide repeat protein [Gammaproteobacteria bacterium]
MRRFAPLLLMLAFVTGTARADFNDGVVALMMGKYDEALQTFVPLAETSDHAFAQYFLGRMYAAGQGVEKNAETAAGWYRKAAEKGVADAQVRLAEMYENGEGVPADLEYAFGWYSVAAHLGNPKGNEGQERTTAALADGERVEAEKLAREFIKQYGNVPRSTARQQ